MTDCFVSGIFLEEILREKLPCPIYKILHKVEKKALAAILWKYLLCVRGDREISSITPWQVYKQVTSVNCVTVTLHTQTKLWHASFLRSRQKIMFASEVPNLSLDKSNWKLASRNRLFFSFFGSSSADSSMRMASLSSVRESMASSVFYSIFHEFHLKNKQHKMISFSVHEITKIIFF